MTSSEPTTLFVATSEIHLAHVVTTRRRRAEPFLPESYLVGKTVAKYVEMRRFVGRRPQTPAGGLTLFR